MFAIELYRKYLHNSTQGISNRDKESKLIFEKEKISQILKGVNDLFYNDYSLKNKDDCSIYTYIKRDIVKDILQRDKDVVICESRFFLQGIINEIEIMQKAMVA